MDNYRYPKDKTKQEIFDEVARHLLQQGVKAQSGPGDCVLRDVLGNKCAVGCLIRPDDNDAFAVDGGYATLVQEHPKYWAPQHGPLISHLQDVHDEANPTLWETRLRQVAERHNLVFVEDLTEAING